jgi:hypothetical protein
VGARTVASDGAVRQLHGGVRDVRTKGCARPQPYPEQSLGGRGRILPDSRRTAWSTRDGARDPLLRVRLVALAHMGECRARWDDASTVARRGRAGGRESTRGGGDWAEDGEIT